MAKKKSVKDYNKERKLWSNWKTTIRKTWENEWEHKKTGAILNLSSEGPGPHSNEATWDLVMSYPMGSSGSAHLGREYGGPGDYMSSDDRYAKKSLMKQAKRFMKQSNNYTTTKQFKQLTKRYKP
ncbi:hypothetical protein LCGC14_0838300 [marine sediment metagenome]|uniref:Uncharacterized protein n=1 Tax=marine sediment metagenome TaxID=412755 RepID=A0A0F9SL66_9ZZZZ